MRTSQSNSCFARSQGRLASRPAALEMPRHAEALNLDPNAAKDAKVLSKPFHRKDIVNEVEQLLALCGPVRLDAARKGRYTPPLGRLRRSTRKRMGA
jgi:hypothetical protein